MEQINDSKNIAEVKIPRLRLINVWRHFKTITQHKVKVCQHCFKMGLYYQGLTHDLSKYSFTEFWVGCRFYQGTRSPNAKEREIYGLSKAWLHHKGRNKHHFEYWIDFSCRASDKPYGILPCKMPDRYIAEMVADRVAACKIYMGEKYTSSSPLEYYLASKKKGVPMHPYTQEMLEKFLYMLADEGEEKTFSYIKNVFLKKHRH